MRLPLKKNAFAVNTPAISRQCAVVAHHAMARDRYSQRVGAAGLGNGPNRSWGADKLGDVAITRSRTSRNLLQRLPDSLLKGSAADIERKVQP